LTEILHKPKDMEEARRRLLKLSGRAHAAQQRGGACTKDGETLWRHVSVARMTMRKLDPGFVGRHLASVGDRILSSVGAYQYEGEGIQLFERIEGDYFTIIGLPMLPLLAELAQSGGDRWLI
jgi:septum formation protein